MYYIPKPPPIAMRQYTDPSAPIEDESSVVEQSIVEATIILQEVIDEYPHSINIEDLKEIMSHLKDAHTASVEERQAEAYYTEPVGSPYEKAQAEGERQAEAEAERQADAQAEMNAEACYGDDLDGGWY